MILDYIWHYTYHCLWFDIIVQYLYTHMYICIYPTQCAYIYIYIQTDTCINKIHQICIYSCIFAIFVLNLGVWVHHRHLNYLVGVQERNEQEANPWNVAVGWIGRWIKENPCGSSSKQAMDGILTWESRWNPYLIVGKNAYIGGSNWPGVLNISQLVQDFVHQQRSKQDTCWWICKSYGWFGTIFRACWVP